MRYLLFTLLGALLWGAPKSALAQGTGGPFFSANSRFNLDKTTNRYAYDSMSHQWGVLNCQAVCSDSSGSLLFYVGDPTKGISTRKHKTMLDQASFVRVNLKALE